MGKLQKLSLWLAFLLLSGVAVYLWALRDAPDVAKSMVEAPAKWLGTTDTSTAPASPVVPPTATDSPRLPELRDPALPTLAASDAALTDALGAMAGGRALLDVLVPTERLKRCLGSLEHLTSPKLPRTLRCVVPVPGTFTVDGLPDAPVVGAANAARYAPLIDAFLGVDPAAMVALYRRWYPLLQAVYAQWGGPNHLLHPRVLGVIDHLLAVQVPTAPVALRMEEGRYRFADPALEGASAGTKMLLRMGAAHAARVQQRLRDYRALLATGRATSG